MAGGGMEGREAAGLVDSGAGAEGGRVGTAEVEKGEQAMGGREVAGWEEKGRAAGDRGVTVEVGKEEAWVAMEVQGRGMTGRCWWTQPWTAKVSAHFHTCRHCCCAAKGTAGSQGGRQSLDVRCWAWHACTDKDAHRVGRGCATHTCLHTYLSTMCTTFCNGTSHVDLHNKSQCQEAVSDDQHTTPKSAIGVRIPIIDMNSRDGGVEAVGHQVKVLHPGECGPGCGQSPSEAIAGQVQ